ncbi:MAG: bifunctional phosphoserine phosphatase/homoserine phosphotransferase ThrH [Gammaproteobacteria bacterium]|nr:bifunctional phosphoserine phosphatase/homoserine phosphotransferase ThrH [Gammaproteobacteria bacterium]
MYIACLDLEGVLVPEIWINVAERTGIEELRATTRDFSDYDELMRHRLGLVDRHELRFADIKEIIDSLTPLPGALAFLNWLRERCQVIILSDTYYEFADRLMRQLGWPALFCHRLELSEDGRIVGYRLRMHDQKRASVATLQSLDFRVLAVGDSYNDTTMLGQADAGILFRPPQSVIEEFPQYPVTKNYDELSAAVLMAAAEFGFAEEETRIPHAHNLKLVKK